jgi:formate dehydrogenase subunit gamma
MKSAQLAIFLIAFGVAGTACAQGAATGSAQSGVAGQSSLAARQELAPGAPAVPGGIQGQNIFEVRPDASSDANYLKQSNAQRNQVQPGNNGPMWHAVGRGVTGYSSLPKSEAPEAGNLIQPFVQYPGSRLTNAGEAWRQVRNQWIIPYGGSLFLIALLAIAIYYLTKGPITNHAPETGRKIERFTPFERAAHWSNAIAFSILALSGLVMAFGKFILQPVIGGALFGWLTWLLKTMHNFAGPLFAVSLAIVFFTFLRDNWPQKGDIHWLLKGGGLISGNEPPSHRFNAGEKIVFWGGVFFLGVVVVSSGFVLDKLLPGLVYERATMQIAQMVHGIATVLMMCMFAGHIYLGTIGMQGAFKGMETGYVDETWAREHHAYWYEDIQAGRIPPQRSAPPAHPQPDALV